MNRRALTLLAAAAAYGAYRYNKMTPEQKTNLKTRGKELFDKYLGSLGNVGNMFGKKEKTAMDGSDY